LYVIAAFVLIAVVLTTALASRFSVPLILISLGVGVVFGSDVTGLIWFDDTHLANALANGALMFILFTGGFGTSRESFRLVFAPAMSLATIGVLFTAALTALAAWALLGLPPMYAMLIGAIVSSTDAAAVFSILRTRSIHKKVAATAEVESAANDPMAIILTTLLVSLATQEATHGPWWQVGLDFFWQLSGGVAIGLAVGWAGTRLFRLLKHADRGYFYVLLIGLVFLGFGLADFIKASGMLAVFFAGLVIGNSRIPFRHGIDTFLEALSTIANVGLFVLLGLLVFPHEFAKIWIPGVGVFLVLTFVARPIAVWLSTMGAGFKNKEKLFISWAGVRGAVPIVLATYPAAAGIQGGGDVFNIVFFAVALSVMVQGATIGKFADLLGLSRKARAKPRQAMELITFQESDLELCELTAEGVPGAKALVSDLALPNGATITMVNRNEQIIAPRGSTEIVPGDVLYVLTRTDDRDAVARAIARALAQV